ncbi:MAG: methyltransferase MtaB domain-containing protein [bacterium]
MRKTFSRLTVAHQSELMFGRATHPVECGFGLRLGGGLVFPELNFTLPPISIEESTWSNVRAQYEDIIAMIAKASKRLQLPGLLVEYELLPPMTVHPEWGAEITALLHTGLKQMNESEGIPCALRVTPTDIRDQAHPPQLRSDSEWETLMKSFELCAKAGADILSIESVGSKEVNDEAMLYGDITGVVFALGVLAPRDMEFLWKEIVRVCEAHRVIPGGDSACGFANTAMQLASQGMLPEVFAAVVRAASAVRSLVAFECGAVGPSKDCAYEGPVLKAITGAPISMEGKSASCAHFSPVGNIAAAMCDVWSNESVQNVRLLSGSAPEAFLELLAYDCRLLNTATAHNTQAMVQQLLVDSDAALSPQALVLTPESTMQIATAIINEATPYKRTVAASREALRILSDAMKLKRVQINEREKEWLGRIEEGLSALPSNEDILIGLMAEQYGHLYSPKSYGM